MADQIAVNRALADALANRDRLLAQLADKLGIEPVSPPVAKFTDPARARLDETERLVDFMQRAAAADRPARPTPAATTAIRPEMPLSDLLAADAAERAAAAGLNTVSDVIHAEAAGTLAEKLDTNTLADLAAGLLRKENEALRSQLPRLRPLAELVEPAVAKRAETAGLATVGDAVDADAGEGLEALPGIGDANAQAIRQGIYAAVGFAEPAVTPTA